MSEHEIVSTFDVEDTYVVAHDPIDFAEETRLRTAFRVWLREIRARVWDEAIQDYYDRGRIGQLDFEDSTNPYREA